MTIYKVDGETVVNSTLTSDQTEPSVVALSGGGWIVTWTSNAQDGSGTGVYQQRFDTEGHAVGGETLVNITTANRQGDPSVAALSNGGWVVTWTSTLADDTTDLFQQCYDANGNAAWAADHPVNSTTARDQNQSNVTGLSDGGWVVTWTSFAADGSSDIHQKHFDSSGQEALGGDRIVNVFTTGSQANPSVTALSDGGWLVSWQSGGQDNGIPHIYQQRYDQQGVAASAADVRIGATSFAGVFPVIASLADGGRVIAWISTDGGEFNVVQQRFDKDGQPASPSEILVNMISTPNFPTASVTALTDGGWVVTWYVDRSSPTVRGVFQQHFDKNGVAEAPIDLLVNAPSEFAQSNPDVTALPDGGWLVTWASSDGSQSDIHQQRFMPNKAPSNVVLADIAGIAEAAMNGTVVSVLSGVDVNVGSGDSLTYTLVDDADGRFALQGDTLIVADGLRLDFEQSQSHAVKVIATDKDGLSVERVLTVQVVDVATENVSASAGADHLLGGAGADIFRGLGGDDVLAGGSGNDTLDGGAGADRMEGGSGDDTYYIDSASDVVVEVAGGGTDTAIVSFDFNLSALANVEILKLADGTQATRANGGAGNDHLIGNTAFNIIDGGAGADTMEGGAGSDVFVVDNAGDVIVEAAGNGMDSAQIGVSYVLTGSAEVEFLTATGKAAINLTGNAFDNVLFGNGSANRLTGGAGNDTLYGGVGKDILVGGAGRDIFVFDTKPNTKTNLDRIVDFSVKDDSLYLDNLYFTKLGKGTPTTPTKLAKKAFWVGTASHDKDDRVIYDKKKGVLLYDPDGTGHAAAVQIAKMNTNLKMTFADVFVI